jgi:hypothetical protein
LFGAEKRRIAARVCENDFWNTIVINAAPCHRKKGMCVQDTQDRAQRLNNQRHFKKKLVQKSRDEKLRTARTRHTRKGNRKKIFVVRLLNFRRVKNQKKKSMTVGGKKNNSELVQTTQVTVLQNEGKPDLIGVHDSGEESTNDLPANTRKVLQLKYVQERSIRHRPDEGRNEISVNGQLRKKPNTERGSDQGRANRGAELDVYTRTSKIGVSGSRRNTM